MGDLIQLHEKVTREIIEENNQWAAASIAMKHQRAQLAEQRMQKSLAATEAAGLKVSQLQSLQMEMTKQSMDEVKVMSAQMKAESQRLVKGPGGLGIQNTFLPDGAKMLTPAWTASFSDNDVQDELTSTNASSDISAQDVIGGSGVQKWYNWASGGGWGCLGSGVGEIQHYAYWGFWFYAPANRFYSVYPLFQLRGFVIAKADDAWYDCKNARVIGSVETAAWQYGNWLSGYNGVQVYNDSGDNINLHTRRDIDRYTYNAYLFGADWAYISCRIGIYARAQGGGSYAENNFHAGTANYLNIPYCYVL